jgi:Uncharacterized protein conserved in bacteria (DUF2332)
VRELADRFRTSASEFETSPLYRALCSVVAEDERLLGMLDCRRPGQDPSFLRFGAVHYLLLSGVEHPLSRFYASVSADPIAPDAATGWAFRDFCRRYEADLRSLIARKLVQTNVVRECSGRRRRRSARQ